MPGQRPVEMLTSEHASGMYSDVVSEEANALGSDQDSKYAGNEVVVTMTAKLPVRQAVTRTAKLPVR